MIRLLNSRKTLAALAIIIALVAIVVPTCRMVGCEMQTGGRMGFMHYGDALGFFSNCGGSWSNSATPVGVVPPSPQALLLLVLMAAIGSMMLLRRPQVLVHAVRIVDADPPPPPEDPRGERLRV
jgi:hypothetical protein